MKIDARLHVVALLLIISVSSPAHGDATKPVVAIVAHNGGTEVTDFLVPLGVLGGSNLAEVHAVALTSGPVTLHPSHSMVELPHTIATFDAAHPHGADYVIVPAVHDAKDAALATWLRTQAARGAVIMSICEGAKVLAEAGLLQGATATTHWYSLKELRRRFPETNWRNDRRYIVDGKVITTSGVSASVPATLALLQLIAGPEATSHYAQTLGISAWPAEHDGAAFRLSAQAIRTAAANRLAFWRQERLGLELAEPVDEATAALIMDAYSRTYRARVVLHAKSSNRIVSRHGLVFHAGTVEPNREIDSSLLRGPLGQTLDSTLDRIAADYGAATADFVALQLEYIRGHQGAAIYR